MCGWRCLPILACAAALLAAGCEATPPKEAQGRDIQRPAFGFALDVPQGWAVRDLSGDVVLELYPSAAPAPAETRAITRLRPVIQVVVVDREDMTLEAWADDAIRESQDLQSDLEVVSRTPARLADGREALLVVLKNPRGLEPFVQRLLLAMTGSRAYALMLTTPQPDAAAIDGAAKKCFDSFVVW
jgi:hypothetical protein